MSLQLKDLPFNLHASDIVKHIINIDSRFREPGPTATSSNFQYRLLAPIRNVLRIRITSLEVPNNYHIFSKLRRNVTIIIRWEFPLGTGHVFELTIPDGNYTADRLVNQINSLLSSSSMQWLVVSFDANTGQFSFTSEKVLNISKPFTVDTACAGLEYITTTCGEKNYTFDRPFDYGLGYNLGFSRGIHTPVGVDASGQYVVMSDQLAYLAGDPYIFLKINNFECVRQTIGKNDFTALAKLVLREPKDYMTFDDYAGQHAKEVTFPAPYDLSRFEVQLLDPYGAHIDMQSSQFSFSMEVLEVRNLSLYNTIRDAFATLWTS